MSIAATFRLDYPGFTLDVRDALCEGTGPLGALLGLAENSENGDIFRLTAALAELPGLSAKALNRTQTQALQWANSIAQEQPA